jgi:predicted nucleic acid-binding protein
MSRVLVDSNVLLDIFTEDPVWFDWSSDTLAKLAEQSVLVINPIVYAEVSVGFEKIEELEQALPGEQFVREPLPWEAGFLAGKSYTSYRKRGGERRSPLPDFYIGAHAAVRKMSLVTRDVARYRTYFPSVTLVTP